MSLALLSHQSQTLCMLLVAVACGGGAARTGPAKVDNHAIPCGPHETVVTFDAHQVRILERNDRSGNVEVHGTPLSCLDQARHVMGVICDGAYHWAFASDVDARAFNYAREFDHPETIFWNVRYTCQ